MKQFRKTSMILLIIMLFITSLQAQNKWNVATSSDESYNWPMIGNGELQTIVGPNGYHNGKVLEVESVNRTIFWAGRRHKDARTSETWIPRFDKDIPIGSTQPLVRFGRLIRQLKINGFETKDDNWEQTLDYDRAIVISTLNHNLLQERTESMILLNQNIMVFHTTLTNTNNNDITAEFILKYEFGDAYGKQATGTKLFIFRPYHTDRLFGSIDGKFSTDPDVESRAPHISEGLIVKYEVEDHLGEVRWGRSPVGRIQKTPVGGNFIHEIKLKKGESTELWFWANISDRLKYTYFPSLEQVKQNINEHTDGWKRFWNTSSVNLNNPELEDIYKSSLYTLRCNSGQWSSSCGILASNWEGRFLHDEMFVFFGLISANHPELARKIPNWRWLTYDLAVQRSRGNGTFYAWESTEEGNESSPIGQWVDERYIHGEISEHTWRYYLYTGDKSALEQFYPVLKGNVEWLIYDVLKYDESGNIRLRAVVPPVEHVYPAENCMYTICAFTRALQIASRAATILGKDKDKVNEWIQLSEKIKKLMPIDTKNNVYKIAANMDDSFGIAHLGSLFPFAVELESDVTKNTLNEAVDYYQRVKEQRTTDYVFSTTTWIWGLSNLVSACFVAGEGEKGYNILKDAKYTIGSFMTPPEHWNKQDGAYLPWHTTGSGAYIAAINGMFIQVYDENGAIIFPAISPELKNTSFNHLLASEGVAVSGKMENGKIVQIVAHSPIDKEWTYRIPAKLAKNIKFDNKLTLSNSITGKYAVIRCKLAKGDNILTE
jgi:expansin (peptidoglycan-binding protein)